MPFFKYCCTIPSCIQQPPQNTPPKIEGQKEKKERTWNIVCRNFSYTIFEFLHILYLWDCRENLDNNTVRASKTSHWVQLLTLRECLLKCQTIHLQHEYQGWQAAMTTHWLHQLLTVGVMNWVQNNLPKIQENHYTNAGWLTFLEATRRLNHDGGLHLRFCLSCITAPPEEEQWYCDGLLFNCDNV